MSALENETTSDTATFEHFGKTWTVPTKKHHRHIRQVKEIARAEGGLDADDIAKVYLSPEQYAELVDLDVASDDLDAFATAIAKALGLGDSGNSQPSSATS
jgi:hypothetical protein